MKCCIQAVEVGRRTKGGMRMVKYVVKRLLMLIPVIIGVTLLIYVVMSLAPGNPAELILGSDATQEAIAAKEAELGLNEPVLLRYEIGRAHV